MLNRLVALAALTLAVPAFAQPVPPGTVDVVLTTEAGPITVQLDARHAPLTTANFLRYVDGHRLDGITFYRVMRLPYGEPPSGLIQAGLRGDPKRVFKPVAHEATTQTGLTHKAGAISMARYAPGTATADFSILLSDMPGLDADPKAADRDTAAGYAVFGQVVSGMDVARKIYDAPLSPTAGQGVLKGQMLAKPVRIITVRRAPAAKK